MDYKKLIFIGFAALLLLLAGFVLAFLFTPLNNFRINKANIFEEEISGEKTNKENLILLSKSNLLYPTDSKRLQVISLLNTEKDQATIKYHLRRLKSQDGLAMAASYFYFNGELKTGDLLLSRINDFEIKDELVDSRKVIAEGFLPSEDWFLGEKKTAAGKILGAIWKLDFDSLSQDLPPENDFSQIAQYKNISYGSRALAVEEMLRENSVPYLAKLAIGRVEALFGPSKVTKVRHALVEEVFGNNDLALSYYLEAYELDPTDETVISKIVSIARKLENTSDSDFYSERLRYLKALKEQAGFYQVTK